MVGVFIFPVYIMVYRHRNQNLLVAE